MRMLAEGDKPPPGLVTARPFASGLWGILWIGLAKGRGSLQFCLGVEWSRVIIFFIISSSKGRLPRSLV